MMVTLQLRLKMLVLMPFVFMFMQHCYADEQLDEHALLENIFPTSCHFSGEFSQQKEIKGLPTPLISKGNFYFSCGLGLIWYAQSPFKETLLFANASNNFRIDDKGDIEPLSGKIRYGMSNIFLKLLKGDSDYFSDEFAVSQIEESGITQLTPESGFMKKGIDRIHIQKTIIDDKHVALNIGIFDVTGQVTEVDIFDIKEYDINGKKEASEQCEILYPSPKKWCRMLRSPWRYKK